MFNQIPIKELVSEQISIKTEGDISKIDKNLNENVPDIDGFVHGSISRKAVDIPSMN